MIRVSNAMVSLARDPFPFLLTVLACRFLQSQSWGWLATLVGAGFCVEVFEQALRSDSAPPPRSKNLPRRAYLGCLGGCGLWLAGLFSMLVFSLVFTGLGLEQYSPLRNFGHHPWVQGFMLVVLVWLTQSVFISIYLAFAHTAAHDRAERLFNGFFAFLFTILKRPPLNGSGLRLALLLLAGAACQPCLTTQGQSALQYSCLFFATLYAHCLGQYVRKTHGFQIRE